MRKPTYDELIGANVRAERSRRNWSRQKAAEILGISRGTYARLEIGRNPFKVKQLQALADAMGIEPRLFMPNRDAYASSAELSTKPPAAPQCTAPAAPESATPVSASPAAVAASPPAQSPEYWWALAAECASSEELKELGLRAKAVGASEEILSELRAEYFRARQDEAAERISPEAVTV